MSHHFQPRTALAVRAAVPPAAKSALGDLAYLLLRQTEITR
jgi:hypothetical protein